MEDKIADLTQKRQQVLSLLPATYSDIVESLKIERSTARDHMSAIRAHGIPIGSRTDENGKKEFYRRDIEREHPVNETEPKSVRAKESKSQTSKRLNDEAHQMEQRLLTLLEQSQPQVADGGLEQDESHEDVVIHATDDHVGDVTEDEFGNTTYDVETWRQRRNETFERCFNLVERQKNAGCVFDTLHLLLGGDIVTGEGIYEGQAHDLQLTLDDQVETAAKFYMAQIHRAADRFESVQVVCQSGNHGELRLSGASSGANADRLLYLMLDGMVRQSGLENVTFIRNSSTKFTNFDIKGHRGHLRHGDESLEHIGTSSGKRRWFNWRDKHQFDIGYRGHYHQFQIDTLTRTFEEFQYDENGNIITDDDGQPVTELTTEDVPVVMSGSPKPPEEFEESIAKWSQPAATIHGVSEDKPMTWFYPVHFA